MIISAKFPSACNVCGRSVKVDDRVSWVKGTKGVAHIQCSTEGKKVVESIQASRATDSGFECPAPEGLTFLPYQKAGIAFILGRLGSIVGDEMGLGKTVQAIGAINADPAIRTVLVICPMSLKLNWRNELNKWSSRSPEIFVFPEQRLEFGALADGAVRIVVCNYDQLKKLPLCVWDLVVIDEAQYVKNPKAKRTELVKAIADRSKRRILLTGTPLPNRPLELWSLLQIADPEDWDPAGFSKGHPVGPGQGAGFFRYAKRYCDAKQVSHGRSGSHWDFTGSSNLNELQEKLRSTCMVRRLKKDVLKDLPPKRRQIIALNAPVSDSEHETFDSLNLSYDDAIEVLTRDRVAFTELSKARHVTALAKVPSAIEHITDALDGTDKLIVFAHHLDVIDELEKGLFGHGVVTITSATCPEERQRNVERFQTDPSVRIIIGSIGAMGVGHTLTASSHVIFVEQSWVPAEMSQAEDRAHRIGQLDSVLIEILVSDGSVDANIMQTVIAKQAIADLALDVETFADISDREMVAKKETPVVNQVQVDKTLQELRFLAARCDGAFEQDGMGFNKIDSSFGKQLAQLPTLTYRQLEVALRMLVKYKRQLGRSES
jgi:SWI/SNF-related matrix-associated actin-dependent regulator of chromatin subfamily A-like protein 1